MQQPTVLKLQALRNAKAKELNTAITAQGNSITDNYGVTTTTIEGNPDPNIKTGKKTEVRTFADDSYHRVTTEDFEHRVNVLVTVATQEINEKFIEGPEQKRRLSEVEQFQREALAALRKPEVIIDPKRMRDPDRKEYYTAINNHIKEILLKLNVQLATSISLDNTSQEFNLGKALRHLNELTKNHVEKQGRPNFVNVSGLGIISAQFPKGDKTIPANRRDKRDANNTPNSAVETIAYQKNSASPLTVESNISRSVSFSVIGLKGPENKLARIFLNKENAKAEITAMAKQIAEAQDGDPNNGDKVILNVASTSLITPWISKKFEGMAEKLLAILGTEYLSESRQLKDHNRALKMLDGQTVDVELTDGRKIAVEIHVAQMNIPVNIKDEKFTKFGIDDPHTFLAARQTEINQHGWLSYCENQEAAINNSSIDSQYKIILNRLKSNIPEADQNKINNLKQEIQNLYKDLGDNNLNKLETDPANIQTKTAAYLAKEKAIRRLERALAKLEKKLVEQRQTAWLAERDNLDTLAQRAVDKLADKSQAMSPAAVAEKERLTQLVYYVDVQKQFYTGAYKKHKNASLFAAQVMRSGELANVQQAVNCKSGRDRTGKACEEVQTLVLLENTGSPFRHDHPGDRQKFDEKFPLIHERSANGEALHSGTPGIRGNRVDWDKTGIDSKTSGLAKIKLKKLKKDNKLESTMFKDSKDVESYLAPQEFSNKGKETATVKTVLATDLKKISNAYLKSKLLQLDREKFPGSIRHLPETIAALNAYFNNTPPEQMTISGLYEHLRNVMPLPLERVDYANAIIQAQAGVIQKQIKNTAEICEKVKTENNKTLNTLNDLATSIKNLSVTPTPAKNKFESFKAVMHVLAPWTSLPMASRNLNKLEEKLLDQKRQLETAKKSLFSTTDDKTLGALLQTTDLTLKHPEEIVKYRKTVLDNIGAQQTSIVTQLKNINGLREKLNVGILPRILKWVSSNFTEKAGSKPLDLEASSKPNPKPDIPAINLNPNLNSSADQLSTGATQHTVNNPRSRNSLAKK